jgi:lipoprotein-anchoring transpeptidase ErfK/SrfK
MRSLPGSRRTHVVLGAVAVVVSVVLLAAAVWPSAEGAETEQGSATTVTAVAGEGPATTAPAEVPDAERVAAVGHPVALGAPLPPLGPVPPVQVAVPTSSLIATPVAGEVGITSAPDGPATMVLPATTTFGGTRTFLVVPNSQQPGWVQVYLPTRPNGSTGWVQTDAVRLSRTTYAVAVDLGARALTVFDGGVPIITTAVAVGKGSAPTPTGLHYVTDVISTPSPGGAYGPYAFGLSSHSDVLTEFAGGDGQVGIHGTNQPGLMGQAVSSGCVRLPNAVVTQLVGLLPLGTPVQIV